MVKVDESSPARTFTSDWEYVEGAGELDECNGAFFGGEYFYFITNEFPYVPRCLKGEFEEELSGESGGAVPGGPGGDFQEDKMMCFKKASDEAFCLF